MNGFMAFMRNDASFNGLFVSCPSNDQAGIEADGAFIKRPLQRNSTLLLLQSLRTMRNEEITTLAELDDRCQLGLNNLRKGFRELYDEIDLLSHRATLDGEAAKLKLEHTRTRRTQHVDDLLAYARNFIREARSSIVTFDEHGVQCEVEEKRNKKVATPSSWMKPPEPVVPRVEPVEETATQRYAIQITQIEQLRISRATSPQVPLNNEVSVEQPKEVRNIGTNVNFVTQRAVKRTNMQGYMMPVNRPCPRRPQSVREQPSQPVLKPRKPATAPVATSRRHGQPSVRTFTDDQFKQLFDRFLSMQSEKGNSGEHILAKPAEEKLEEKQCDVGMEVENVTPSTNEQGETVDDVNLDTSVELPKLSRHALPSVSIQGRWDANLKVQQTGNINILDVKDDDQAVMNSNIKYIELRHGHARLDGATGDRNKSSEFVKESNLDVAPNALKLNNENGTSEQAETSGNKESSPRTAHDDIEASSKESSAHHEKPVVLVPRSVCKSARSSQKLSKTRNKYLEPFLKQNCREKSNSEIVLEVFDDDTSGTSGNEDSAEEDIRLLLNLTNGTSSESSSSVAQPKSTFLNMPQTAQCQRSLLEVSSIPALRSPSKSSIQNNSKSSGSITPTSDVDIISNQNESNERFLSKLRIWNAAVEAQSQNMNLGNQLTETIDDSSETFCRMYSFAYNGPDTLMRMLRMSEHA
ncbi:hypothetical protein ZHAS_00021815 [Anopheles sinensis]|uniref:Uncharacterized protein n=1 Tax=Anopheles sinensis TaxID=74873 RepID=A0A084WTN6_ANOSI|nr:hypothetical protein ZHAS_00021815 [Anopheles sinensis]